MGSREFVDKENKIEKTVMAQNTEEFKKLMRYKVKPTIYIKYGVLPKISPFDITKKPENINRRKAFITFEDSKYYYIVEKKKPKRMYAGSEWFEKYKKSMGIPQSSEIIEVKSEEELKNDKKQREIAQGMEVEFIE